MPRSHSLVLVAFIYLMSQVVAANVSNISNLWIASTLLGLAHGSISALIPIVCLEWFGLREFSSLSRRDYTKTNGILTTYQLIFLRTGDLYACRLLFLLVFFPSSLEGALMHTGVKSLRTFCHLHLSHLGVCKDALATWTRFLGLLVQQSFLCYLAFGRDIGIA